VLVLRPAVNLTAALDMKKGAAVVVPFVLCTGADLHLFLMCW